MRLFSASSFSTGPSSLSPGFMYVCVTVCVHACMRACVMIRQLYGSVFLPSTLLLKGPSSQPSEGVNLLY